MGRPTDLLDHVTADLTGCEVVRTGVGQAVVAPPDGRRFRIEVRQERRRLLQLQTLLVHVDGSAVPPDLDASGSSPRLVFHHTGQVRRTGLAATVRRGGSHRRWSGELPASVVELRARLLADDELTRASLALDFTRFEVAVVDGRWRASLELMGASHVRTTFPPSARYVRLTRDQLAPLLATIEVLQGQLPGVEPGLPTTRARSGADRPAAHLPGRSA
jgi:hypothetical protein